MYDATQTKPAFTFIHVQLLIFIYFQIYQFNLINNLNGMLRILHCK